MGGLAMRWIGRANMLSKKILPPGQINDYRL